MKHRKQRLITTIVITASAAFAGVAICQETISNVQKQEPVSSATDSNKVDKIDLATTKINQEILAPVRLQANRYNKFSRSRVTRSYGYELVENTTKTNEGVRNFDILVTTTISAKTLAKNQIKPEPSVYLKLKYITATNKLLIQQGNEWVERKDHKYLRLIPVSVVSKK